jgi:hypothetical protein
LVRFERRFRRVGSGRTARDRASHGTASGNALGGRWRRTTDRRGVRRQRCGDGGGMGRKLPKEKWVLIYPHGRLSRPSRHAGLPQPQLPFWFRLCPIGRPRLVRRRSSGGLLVYGLDHWLSHSALCDRGDAANARASARETMVWIERTKALYDHHQPAVDRVYRTRGCHVVADENDGFPNIP